MISVIAFIALCETMLSFARRNGPLVAKLYGLGYLVKPHEETSNTEGDPDRPTPRDENELLSISGVGYPRGDGRCSFPATPVTPRRRALQLSGNARYFCVW